MLNEEKVKLMSGAAVYEDIKGKEAIKLNKYFERGAERTALFSNAPIGALTFILVAVFVAAFGQDWILNAYSLLGPVISFIFLAVIFIAFVLAYSFFARKMLKRNYEKDVGTFWKYRFNKKKLENLLDKDEEENIFTEAR